MQGGVFASVAQIFLDAADAADADAIGGGLRLKTHASSLNYAACVTLPA